jgi:hypothetical protein
MAPNLHQMTNTELTRYLLEHRNDEAFRADLEVLISRHNPNVAYQPYPFALVHSEGEVEAIAVAIKVRTFFNG